MAGTTKDSKENQAPATRGMINDGLRRLNHDSGGRHPLQPETAGLQRFANDQKPYRSARFGDG